MLIGADYTTNFTITAFDDLDLSNLIVVPIVVVAPIIYTNFSQQDWNATELDPLLISGTLS
jgi:hypothetical protein